MAALLQAVQPANATWQLATAVSYCWIDSAVHANPHHLSSV